MAWLLLIKKKLIIFCTECDSVPLLDPSRVTRTHVTYFQEYVSPFGNALCQDIN